MSIVLAPSAMTIASRGSCGKIDRFQPRIDRFQPRIDRFQPRIDPRTMDFILKMVDLILTWSRISLKTRK